MGTFPLQVLAVASSSPTATGSTQGDAASLVVGLNVVAGANATKGVILPQVNAGEVVMVVNTVAAVLKIYPPTGGSVNGATANAALGQAASSAALYTTVDGITFYSIPTLPS